MHFLLVHGAYHGSWCWDELRTELATGGHASTAVDLPCDDPDAGAERYVDEILHAVPKQADAVVLVGHSLAGLIIPVAASRTRTAMAIYLCALLPVPGLSFDAQHAESGTGFEPSQPAVGHPDGSASWPEEGAIEVFFHDCAPHVARDAARRLRRQYWKVTQEVTPLRQWPPVPTAYILCTDDRMISRDYGTTAARRQLGVDPIELPGGHSPFLSRPRVLAQALVRAASR
jgi:pimeloyl-ACP methyl ester carboxylesterase